MELFRGILAFFRAPINIFHLILILPIAPLQLQYDPLVHLLLAFPIFPLALEPGRLELGSVRFQINYNLLVDSVRGLVDGEIVDQGFGDGAVRGTGRLEIIIIIVVVVLLAVHLAVSGVNLDLLGLRTIVSQHRLRQRDRFVHDANERLVAPAKGLLEINIRYPRCGVPVHELLEVLETEPHPQVVVLDARNHLLEEAVLQHHGVWQLDTNVQ